MNDGGAEQNTNKILEKIWSKLKWVAQKLFQKVLAPGTKKIVNYFSRKSLKEVKNDGPTQEVYESPPLTHEEMMRTVAKAELNNTKIHVMNQTEYETTGSNQNVMSSDFSRSRLSNAELKKWEEIVTIEEELQNNDFDPKIRQKKERKLANLKREVSIDSQIADIDSRLEQINCKIEFEENAINVNPDYPTDNLSSLYQQKQSLEKHKEKLIDKSKIRYKTFVNIRHQSWANDNLQSILKEREEKKTDMNQDGVFNEKDFKVKGQAKIIHPEDLQNAEIGDVFGVTHPQNFTEDYLTQEMSLDQYSKIAQSLPLLNGSARKISDNSIQVFIPGTSKEQYQSLQNYPNDQTVIYYKGNCEAKQNGRTDIVITNLYTDEEYKNFQEKFANISYQDIQSPSGTHTIRLLPEDYKDMQYDMEQKKTPEQQKEAARHYAKEHEQEDLSNNHDEVTHNTSNSNKFKATEYHGKVDREHSTGHKVSPRQLDNLLDKFSEDEQISYVYTRKADGSYTIFFNENDTRVKNLYLDEEDLNIKYSPEYAQGITDFAQTSQNTTVVEQNLAMNEGIDLEIKED